jgi:hypothetical protein
MFHQHEAPDVPSLRRDFLRFASASFEQMFGSDGRNGLVTFTEREDRACKLGDELSCWLLAKHIGREESCDPGKEVNCPFCGNLVKEESPQRASLQPRCVKSRRGPVGFDRASRLCLKCRRVFFPHR